MSSAAPSALSTGMPTATTSCDQLRVRRQVDRDRHADRDRGVEVDHPAHAFVEHERRVVPGRRRRRGRRRPARGSRTRPRPAGSPGSAEPCTTCIPPALRTRTTKHAGRARAVAATPALPVTIAGAGKRRRAARVGRRQRLADPDRACRAGHPSAAAPRPGRRRSRRARSSSSAARRRSSAAVRRGSWRSMWMSSGYSRTSSRGAAGVPLKRVSIRTGSSVIGS